MSYEISVPTPFNDVSELAESFHSRVDEERLMLPSGELIPEGEWVTFHVTLADGSAALAGQGRCTQSFDNGEDRAPEHRFDVVMDSLQLDEMAQIYFERILQVRAAYAGDEPQTGETQVPEEAAAPVAAAEAAPEEAPADFDAPDEGTAIDDGAVVDAAAEVHEEAPPAYPGGDDVTYDASAYEAEAAPVEGADAYASEVEADAYASQPPGEWDGEDTRAVAYEDVEDAPAEAEAMPVEGMPVEGMPVEGMPVEAMPVEAMPVEAMPVEGDAYDEGGYEEAAAAVEVDAEALPSEELDSGLIEEYPSEDAAPAPAPTLTAPAESRIYDLPDPQAPGALPSPHSVQAVLTRRLLHATWSPTPAERAGGEPSTGYFDYAQGAGLPQPASPPRPDLDPSLRVAPAPQPGDAYVAPAAQQAEEHAEPEPQYEEEPQVDGEYAEAEVEGGYADGEYAEPEIEGEYAEAEADAEYAEAHVEGVYAEAEGEDAEYAQAHVEGEYAEEGEYEAAVDPGQVPEGYEAEAYDPNAEGETRQVDVSALPDDIPIGDETLQVEIPEE